MRVKFGYKAFAAKALPITHPKRPFDKTKDFKSTMKLFVYLTPTGQVSKQVRERTSLSTFFGYSEGFAHIYIHDLSSYKLVNPERIHIKEIQ